MHPSVPRGSHITRKGQGAYRYRRRLPGQPQHEVVMSLRTRNFREAEHLAALLDRVFGSALMRAKLDMPHSSADLNAILRGYLREELDADLRRREERPAGRTVFGGDPYQDPVETDLDLEQTKLSESREDLANRDIRAVEDHVVELIARHGLPETDRRRLALGLLEVQVRFWEEAIKRTRGQTPMWFNPDPVVPFAAPTEVPPTPPSKPLASMLVERSLQHRQEVKRTKEHMIGQERGTLIRFIEVAGDKPVDAYGRSDVSKFLATMRRLPANYGKSPKDKQRTVAELISQADAGGAPRLKEPTLRRHISALSVFFGFARDEGHISAVQRQELVDDHSFTAKGAARTQRDAWTEEELRSLFGSPVWTGCDRRQRSKAGPHVIRDAKFWLPLLGLFHGARLEELADLYRRDVAHEHGIWTLSINEDGRTLKNSNAARSIPLHPELLRMGFLKYVSQAAPHSDDPLFPDLEPQGPDRKRGPRFTRWFGHYRRQIGIYREEVGMHAFRHTAITRLRDFIQTAQQDRHVDFLMGHARGGGEGRDRYDKGPGLLAVAGTHALLSFPELDLSHLYVDDEPAGLPT